MLNYWLLIGILSLSTYISRAIGVEIMAEREMSPTLRLYFNFVPIGVISALIIKQILIPVDGGLIISLPILIACFSTAIALKKTKMFLPSAVFGGIIGMLIRYFYT